MSKTWCWTTLLLALCAIIVIGWSVMDKKNQQQNTRSHQEPTYTSVNISTVVYNPAGDLSYKLLSDKVAYFSTDEMSWFENPIMTTYDKSSTPTWSIRSDKAKLTQEHKLYLCGHVVLNNLNQTSQLERIQTDNALIDLISQDVTSKDQVTLLGQGIHSIGEEMRGNLKVKSAELLKKVKTYYEIQNTRQPQP